MNATVPSIIARWRGQNLAIRPGVGDEALDRVEAKLGVVLPVDLRQFFRAANGLSGTDRAGFSFRAIEQVMPLALETSEYSTVANADRLYVFADYLMWSVGYAISLFPAAESSRHENTVLALAGSASHVIANSFSEFVALYLADDIALIQP